MDFDPAKDFRCPHCTHVFRKGGKARHMRICGDKVRTRTQPTGNRKRRNESVEPKGGEVEEIAKKSRAISEFAEASLDLDALLHEFISSSKGALAPIVDAAVREKDRAGGISVFDCKRDHSIWKDLGHLGPFLFPAEECFDSQPDCSEAMTDIFDKFAKKEAVIYSNDGRPQPGANLGKVIEQLYRPDPSRVVYSNRLAGGFSMKKPTRFAGQKTVSDCTTSTNITPQYAFMDLHIDRGYHVNTALKGGCMKIWIFYPLTQKNWEVWKDYHNSENCFIDCEGKLEHPEVVFQKDGQAVYLPPICLHATITLRSGFVPGIVYTTPESLDTAWRLVELEHEDLTKAPLSDLQPLLDAILGSLIFDQEWEVSEDSKYLCQLLTALKGKHRCLSEIKRNLSKDAKCGSCKKLWKNHWPV